MNAWWDAQLSLQRQAIEQARAALDAGSKLVDAQAKAARAAHADAKATAAWLSLWTAPWS